MEHIPKDSDHAPDDPPIHLQQHNNQSTDISLDDLPDDGTLHRNTFANGEGGDSGSEEIGVSYPFTKAGDAPLDTDDGSWFCDDGVTADEHSDYEPKSLDLDLNDLDPDDQQNQRMAGSTDIDLKNESNDQQRVLLNPVMAEYPQSPCSDHIGSPPIAEHIGESFVADSPRSSFRWTDSFCDEHEEIEEESEEDEDSLMIGCPNIFTQLAMRTGDFVIRHRNNPWFQVGVAVSLCAISVQMGSFTQNALSIGDTAHSMGASDGRQVETASVSHSGNVQYRSVAASTAADVHHHVGDRLLMAAQQTRFDPDKTKEQFVKEEATLWSSDKTGVDLPEGMPILHEKTYNFLKAMHAQILSGTRYHMVFQGETRAMPIFFYDGRWAFGGERAQRDMQGLFKTPTIWTAFLEIRLEKDISGKWVKPLRREFKTVTTEGDAIKDMRDNWMVRQKRRGFTAKDLNGKYKYTLVLREYGSGKNPGRDLRRLSDAALVTPIYSEDIPDEFFSALGTPDGDAPRIENSAGLKPGKYQVGRPDELGDTQLLLELPKQGIKSAFYKPWDEKPKDVWVLRRFDLKVSPAPPPSIAKANKPASVTAQSSTTAKQQADARRPGTGQSGTSPKKAGGGKSAKPPPKKAPSGSTASDWFNTESGIMELSKGHILIMVLILGLFLVCFFTICAIAVLGV